MVDSGNRTGKEKESEGPYTKLVALGTLLLVLLGYLALASQVRWPPFKGSPSPGPANAATSSSSSPPADVGAQLGATTSSPAGLPAGYQGAWQGDLVYGAENIAVSMTLGQGADGAQVGSFVNETLECEATIYLEGGQGPIYLRLVTTTNALGECVSLAYARVTSTSSGLDFTFEDSSEVSPSEPTSDVAPASGTLGQA